MLTGIAIGDDRRRSEHDARMAALSKALAHNSTVTALDLSRNHITAAGAQV